MYRQIAAHPTARAALGDDARVSAALIEPAQGRRVLAARLDALQKKFDALDPEKHLIEPHARDRRARHGGAGHDRRAARTARGAERRSCSTCPTGSPSTASSSASASAAVRRSRRRRADDRLGRGRGAGARARSSRTARRSGSPAKTSSAARSAIATPCSTTRTTARGHVPLQALPQAQRGVRDPQQPAQRERGGRLRVRLQRPGARAPRRSGKRSTATSSTARSSILDEFVLSARAKWGQEPSLVMLLPHGVRRAGPRSRERAARAIPAAGGRHQHARRQLHDRRAVLPPAAPAGGAARSAIRCR